MPDFAMCQNSDCQMSWNCRRFNATPDPIRQSYADFAPDFRGNCEFYWAMDDVKMKKQIIKIGQTEFTLPFEVNHGYGGDSDGVTDADGLELAYCESWNGDDTEFAKTIALALNEHFERRTESEK